MEQLTSLVPADVAAPLTAQLSGWLDAGLAAAPRVAVALCLIGLTALISMGAKALATRIARRAKLRRNLIDVVR
ncbi:MAG: mechanosensitive ion channel family protein, partial [Pseudomonadota bacterium]